MKSIHESYVDDLGDKFKEFAGFGKEDIARMQRTADSQRAPEDPPYTGVKTGPSPTIPAPKARKNSTSYYMPRTIHADENPNSPKLPVPKDIITANNRQIQQDAANKVKTKPSDNDDLSFGRAFAKNRKAGAKEFTWHGKKYNTKIKESLNEKSDDLTSYIQAKREKDSHINSNIQLPELCGTDAKSKFDSIKNDVTQMAKELENKVTIDTSVGKMSPNKKGGISLKGGKKDKKGSYNLSIDPNGGASLNYALDLESAQYESDTLEEEPNIVGSGNIAGVGVGPNGEPGIPKKKKPRLIDLITFMKR